MEMSARRRRIISGACRALHLGSAGERMQMTVHLVGLVARRTESSFSVVCRFVVIGNIRLVSPRSGSFEFYFSLALAEPRLLCPRLSAELAAHLASN